MHHDPVGEAGTPDGALKTLLDRSDRLAVVRYGTRSIKSAKMQLVIEMLFGRNDMNRIVRVFSIAAVAIPFSPNTGLFAKVRPKAVQQTFTQAGPVLRFRVHA